MCISPPFADITAIEIEKENKRYEIYWWKFWEQKSRDVLFVVVIDVGVSKEQNGES